MPLQSTTTLSPSFDSSIEAARRLRERSLVNLSWMGHCAPTVMQTMLDVSGTDAPWLVKLSAGLPGGIGNTGSECGGVTAPLLLMGLRFGREKTRRGFPTVVSKGHDFLLRFAASQGTTSCRVIRGKARVPVRCIGVIRQAPILCAETMGSDCTAAISEEQQEAYGRLSAHWSEKEFHCAQAVFRHLEDAIPVSEELLDSSSGFMGGTVLTGMTCSAFTAGVMALGLALGEIEHSRIRVLRMIGTMAIGGNAFADGLNAFNKIMNLGQRLSRWFTAEFGSNLCRAITQCDFSKPEGVRHYLNGGSTALCSMLAQSVAQRVRGMIRTELADGPAKTQAPGLPPMTRNGIET